jgi:hypothetical protein
MGSVQASTHCPSCAAEEASAAPAAAAAAAAAPAKGASQEPRPTETKKLKLVRKGRSVVDPESGLDKTVRRACSGLFGG